MAAIDLQRPVKFERIMLATDFSPASEIAQAYAVGLALHYSSTLELATIVDLSLTLPSMEVIHESTLEALRRTSENDLRRLAEHIAGITVTRKVIEGFQPASLIVEEAVNSNADLIVLGTTSKHGFKKLALGSTAEAVIRTAPCPILTVGPHVLPPPNFPVCFERIVYATDFSSQASKAAGLALSLGQTCGAKVYLCHVLTEEDKLNHDDSEARSISSLEALIPESVHDWCNPKCIVEHGKSSEAILALASRVNADLIVLGARKPSFWVEYVRTGLTPALLAAANCPVLTVC
ncbi:universal stress protein [Edaphobacter paludis]|uniref:Universal stress protein n=1 Tax=Edaphobacter paludis TaxID=3035702 RepID=A0AAU7D136_9BACT